MHFSSSKPIHRIVQAITTLISVNSYLSLRKALVFMDNCSGYPHLTKLLNDTNFVSRLRQPGCWPQPLTYPRTTVISHGFLAILLIPLPLEHRNIWKSSWSLKEPACELESLDLSNSNALIPLVINYLHPYREWITTVSAWPPHFIYKSMKETGIALSKILRDRNGEHRCDFIIALTHSRWASHPYICSKTIRLGPKEHSQFT